MPFPFTKNVNRLRVSHRIELPRIPLPHSQTTSACMYTLVKITEEDKCPCTSCGVRGRRRHRMRQTAHGTWRPWAMVKRTVVGVRATGVRVHVRGGTRSVHRCHFRRSPRCLLVRVEEDVEFVCGNNDCLAKICGDCASRRHCRDCEVTFCYSCLG